MKKKDIIGKQIGEIKKVEKKIKINSFEGYFRQIGGWREFIRGIYIEEGNFQKTQNYWNHKNKLSSTWYEGNTGLVPLDDAIKTTINDGYIHHIPRLMVISNIMNLCEIKLEKYGRSKDATIN